MKRIITIVLIVILLAVLAQFYRLYRQNISLKENLNKTVSELAALSEENDHLKSDLNYFANPDNLEKELREKLNYKSPGEKLIILVPPKTN